MCAKQKLSDNQLVPAFPFCFIKLKMMLLKLNKLLNKINVIIYIEVHNATVIQFKRKHLP